MKQKVVDALLSGIAELNQIRSADTQLPLIQELLLFGEDGALESMDLVNVFLVAESALQLDDTSSPSLFEVMNDWEDTGRGVTIETFAERVGSNICG